MPASRLVVAIGFLGGALLAGCQDSEVKVYPVLVCPAGCEVITTSGETVKRRLVAGVPEIYSALPATQEVIVQTLGIVQSMTRDKKYTCRVRTVRDWQCTRDNRTPGSSESLTMDDGTLSYFEWPRAKDATLLTYVGRCQWNHVGWRNQTGRKDPDNIVAGLVGWAVGCVLPSVR